MSKELEALDNIKVSLAEYKEYAIDTLPHKAKQIRKENDDDFIIVKDALKDYKQIKKMSEEYNIEFNLVNMRHALFTFAQLKGEHGTNWDNYNKKLKALEIIKNKRVDVNDFLTFVDLKSYNEWVAACDENKLRALAEEEYKLLKEVLL